MVKVTVLLLLVGFSSFCIAGGTSYSERNGDEQDIQTLVVNEYNYRWLGVSDYVADIYCNLETSDDIVPPTGVSVNNTIYCFKKREQVKFLLECWINSSDDDSGTDKKMRIMQPDALVQITLKSKDGASEPEQYIAEPELCRLVYLSNNLSHQQGSVTPSSNLFFRLRRVRTNTGDK